MAQASHDLSALTVVNTRPGEQAARLTELLQQQAFKVIEFPLIEISDLTDTLNSKISIRQLQEYDIVIFISANAVIYFMHLLAQEKKSAIQDNNSSKRSGFPWKLRLATVGKSTAEVLKQQTQNLFGIAIDADIVPQDGSDSESLLKHPTFESCSGKKILIVRGEGGREFLAEQLRLKKAKVEYLAVYRRTCPVLNSAEQRLRVLNIWQQNKIDFIIITSSESLVNLLTILGEALGHQPGEANVTALALLADSKILVVHKKIKAKARQLGFQQEIIVAQQANNGAIASALNRYSE